MLKAENRELTVCYDQKDRSYYSKNCKSARDCLPSVKTKLDLYPNQSPGFSICYQSEGTPFFAVANGVRRSFCEKSGKVVDTETLLKKIYSK